jgi:fido (protein-threonine AMPylation protein)
MDTYPQPRLDPRLMQRLAEKKAQLDRYRPLSPAIMRRLLDDLRVFLTYHSNAIEGNTLDLRETQMIIEHGVTIGGHSLREHLEATDHAAAFNHLIALVDTPEPITTETILPLHRLVLGSTDETAGQFRTTPVSIRGARLTPPPAKQVERLMQEWVAWLEGPGMAYEPVLRATIAHHGFVAVHPFLEGNGRTGRLLLNLMLMRDGYPPALLLHDWRTRYIYALRDADGGNYNPLANLIGRAVESGLDLYLEACAAVPDEEYLPLAALAEITGYASTHLGWLVRKGRLAGQKRGGRWYSTLAAVERYRTEVEQQEYPRGRPPMNQADE